MSLSLHVNECESVASGRLTLTALVSSASGRALACPHGGLALIGVDDVIFLLEFQ